MTNLNQDFYLEIYLTYNYLQIIIINKENLRDYLQIYLIITIAVKNKDNYLEVYLITQLEITFSKVVIMEG
jgi:hypothetical protein